MPGWVTAALPIIERYGLAAMYLWLAWLELEQVRSLWLSWPASEGPWSLHLATFLREASSLCIQLFIGLLLRVSYRPVVEPKQAIDVLLPLAMSTFFVMYGAVRLVPEDLRVSVLPPDARAPCASLGVVMGMFGALIAVWGVVCLGRSFGIFVAVRQVVLHGIYRYVRHPIYLGYLFIWAGLVLVHQSFIILPLVGIHAALMVFRARLEERRLCEASPAYREYMKHTGFLFPLAFRRAR